MYDFGGIFIVDLIKSPIKKEYLEGIKELNITLDANTFDRINLLIRSKGFNKWEEWLEYLSSTILEIYDRGIVISTEIVQSMVPLWVKNAFTNKETILKYGKDIFFLSGKEYGKRVLCIGGGPSLQKQLKELENWNGITIVADRMAKQIRDHGIHIDYIVSLDTHDSVSSFYTGNETEKIILPVTADPSVLDMIKNTEFYMYVPSVSNQIVPNFDYFFSLFFEQRVSVVTALGSTGNWEWKIANIIGASEIGLVGYDMGYPPETPINETAHYIVFAEIFDTDSDDFGKCFIKMEHECLGKGFYSFTDVLFNQFRLGLLSVIAGSNIKTYNCTEGGVLCGIGTPAEEKLICTTLEEFIRR